MFRDHELKHGIAEIFEPLIIGMSPLFFVAHARVRQGLVEQLRLAKLIADAFFKRMHNGTR